MPYTKTILCLANSRKLSGRCIAGREIVGDRLGSWVRPVSSHDHGAVSEADRRYSNGADPRVLDIFAVPMLRSQPHLYQVENHLIDPREHWTFVRRATKAEVVSAIEVDAGPLWNNGSSTRNGLRDRVLPNLTAKADGSLKLIAVTDFTLRVTTEGAQYNNPRRKIRGQFTHAGETYRLAVTDPLIERRYFAEPDADHSIGRVLLCVSLGDVNETDGYAYKLIATVIMPNN